MESQIVAPIMRVSARRWNMQERRRVQRTRVLKAARIICDQHSSAIDCTVLNLTNVGACLRVASSLDVSTGFDLTFDSAHSSRKCRVVWRNEDELGVSFER